MILVSIDPGKDTGWARFFGGKLEACGLGTPPLIKGCEVVIERPQYRAHDRVEIDDVIELALDAGEHRRRAKDYGCRIRMIKPFDWKGSVKKEIHHPRIERVLDGEETERLSDVKKAYTGPRGGIGKLHNIVDAVGLGLFALKRLAR